MPEINSTLAISLFPNGTDLLNATEFVIWDNPLATTNAYLAAIFAVLSVWFGIWLFFRIRRKTP